MTRPSWDDRYRDGFTPWDTGRPEPLLEEALRATRLPVGRALEIGCGTGTNARLLAAAGYEVVAIDVSPTAIGRAMEHPESAGIRFEVMDILTHDPPEGPYDAVFDRGVFHVFDGAAERARFAHVVARALRPGGHWLSIAGSTEGPPRDMGPPRRTARDLVDAIEPALELVELRAVSFEPLHGPHRPTAWWCLSRRRAQAAQPSTRR